MTSFDGLQFDVLNPLHGPVTPQDIPEELGLPINPMLMPADWSASIRISTRWQTDVTQPRTGSREALALASRPARTISANLKGPSHGESYALLQAIQQFAFTEAPVPLYPDATNISSWAHDSGELTIEADLAYRRFFVGCRVVVFSIIHRSSQSDRHSMFGIVTQLDATSMIVQLESTFRTILASDMVAPCIDAEISEGADGQLHTDGVAEVDITWSEIEGGSTLPSLWPSAPHGDTTLLSPIASTATFDSASIALFPGSINWRDGVSIRLVTPADTSASGRSRVLEVTQAPHVEFDLEVLCATRREAWPVLRFFDAMQGRAGTFAFLHPVHAFEVVGTGSNYVEIAMVGSPQAARRQLKFIALVDGDGNTHIRSVVVINDLGTKFRVTWDIANPVADIVEARHAWICAFSEDTLDEEWITSGVTSLQFKITELPQLGALSVADEVFSYQTEVTDPIRSIDGCSLFLKAGVECYDADGIACTLWPGVHHQISRMYDISRLPGRDEEHFNRIYASNFSIYTDSALVRLFDDAGFGTQPILLQAPMQLSISGVQNAYDTLWGPTATGWTMFFVFSPRVRTGTSYQILCEIAGTGLDFGIYVDTPVSASYPNHCGIALNTGSGVVVRPGLFTVENTASARILAVRLDFATNNIQAWLDGVPFITSATYSPAFPTTPNITLAQWLKSSDGNSPVSASTLRTIEGARLLGATTVHYRRALTQDEMRAVYEALAEIYFAPTDTKIVVL